MSTSFFAVACSSDQTLIDNPVSGDIYIFKEGEIYSPMKLDSVCNDTLYLFNSKFVFADAIPSRHQIIDEEFDHNFYLIYEKKEIQRLFKEGKIVEIYR